LAVLLEAVVETFSGPRLTLTDIARRFVGGWHPRVRPGSRQRRSDSRIFLARPLLTLDDGRTVAPGLAEAIGTWDQWVATDHDALLAA
jgi:hypothetical protein